MEIRNMFYRIFGKQKQPSQNLTQMRMLNGYSNEYTPFNGAAYDNATVRSCVDTIARHASKLNPRHIVKKEGKVMRVLDDKLNYLLSVQPNQLMTSAEFIEKIVNQYYTTNNLFVFIQRDMKADVVALWPLDFSQVSLYEDNQNVIYVKFTFGIGLQMTVPYEDIIHIRRHYNRDEMFGDPEAKMLQEDLTLLKSVKTAIVNVVKNYGRLRGIVKFMQTLRPEDMKRHFEEFVNNFVSDVKNGSGIAPMDNTSDYKELHVDNTTFDAAQMQLARDNIYKYFGVSEKLINGTYDESEFIAFYESVIEPLAVKLSQSFTVALFTKKEQGHGNEIMFETNRLNYISVASKINIAKQLLPAGILTINDARELFGYAPVPDGDERIVSLNYIKASDQSKYQTGKEGEDDET
ncbi:MAG: phage portal protein [Acidaminococcaceae bacterium]|nr:phage portal protein [Acidaminococcaceae bacterium]